MNENKIKLNIYRIFGSQLEDRAHKIKKAAFKINYTIMDNRLITDIIKQKTGLTPYCKDRKYWTTDLETINQILEYDWINKKKYISEQRDCDDFADYLNSYMSWVYGLNNFGRFTNTMIYKDGRKEPHRASIFITSDNSMYALEPQTDEIIKVEKNKDIIIGGRRYIPIIITL